MTAAALRPVTSFVLALLVALSLALSTLDAIAATSYQGGDGILLDRASGRRPVLLPPPQGWGRFGVTWE